MQARSNAKILNFASSAVTAVARNKVQTRYNAIQRDTYTSSASKDSTSQRNPSRRKTPRDSTEPLFILFHSLRLEQSASHPSDPPAMTDVVLFDAQFQVKAIDPDGKKFDRGELARGDDVVVVVMVMVILAVS